MTGLPYNQVKRRAFLSAAGSAAGHDMVTYKPSDYLKQPVYSLSYQGYTK